MADSKTPTWLWVLAGGGLLAYLASKTDTGSELVTAATDALPLGDNMHLTADQLAQAADVSLSTALSVIDPLNTAADYAKVNTVPRWAMFVAQLAHESDGFNAKVENLNYSADALVSTWPTHFDAATAASYARRPEQIANRAYANRLGNGDEASGDGWLYRGRGFIQLTGKANYADAGNAMGVDFVSNPDLVMQPQYASLAAGWFWKSKVINAPADDGDVKRATKIINGGAIGLAERQELYDNALAVLKAGGAYVA